MIRNPIVAGAFYEGSKEKLLKQIEWCFKHNLGPGKIPEVNQTFSNKLVGVIMPHAGYMYSGPIAAYGASIIAENGKPDSFIIIGPNHSGLGAPVAIMKEGIWRTPLGQAKVDNDLAMRILELSDIVEDDYYAHVNEHSIEVQLPFLQYLFGEINFVPICLMLQNHEIATSLGTSLAKAINGRKVIIIASTDFSHYEPYNHALQNDNLIIDKIINFDVNGFFKTFYSKRISMCGPGSVSILIVAARILGAKQALKLKYATSGDTSGDFSSVVGYSSIAFLR